MSDPGIAEPRASRVARDTQIYSTLLYSTLLYSTLLYDLSQEAATSGLNFVAGFGALFV